LWTICAGDPPPGPLSPFAVSLHERWDTGREAGAARRAEDLRSCAILGAEARHFPLPDCIYRRSAGSGDVLYGSEEAIAGPIREEEADLVRWLTGEFSQALEAGANLVCPMAVGGHVDHRLVRSAAEKTGGPLWYYADYPYVLKEEIPPVFRENFGCQDRLFSISRQALSAWGDSIAAHTSQISTFWQDLAAMRASIERYCLEQGGVHLWRF
jgi:LmbE family N-acetylglucosaminyl deacetylase